MSYSGKTVLVAGAGRSGIAAARFLLARNARVILTDIRGRSSLETALSPILDMTGDSGKLILELGGHRNESFGNCDLVVTSPGIPLNLPVFEISRKAGIPIIAEVELAYRHLKGTIIGITGSNGKTTTTTLVSGLLSGTGLKGYAAGNIGAPLISFVANSSPENIYAVELSSFQLEGINSFHPYIGSILNLTRDHMDRYSGFDEYIAAKRRIFMNQQKTDFAVLNADDTRTAEMEASVSSKPVMFSRTKAIGYGVFLRNDRVIFRDEEGERDLFGVGSIALKGAHNLENVLASCAMAILAGAPVEGLEEIIRGFKGVEHRIEFVCEVDGVQYFNDSKATNVAATIKSLEAFPGRILLIAGGRDKEGDFTVLRPLVRERVKQIVLIGESAEKIKKALSDATDIRNAESIQEAVLICRELAVPGDVVLLAPACASFDMFENYEQRGQVFKEAVYGLQKL